MTTAYAWQILGVSAALIAGGLLALKVASDRYDRKTREIEQRQAAGE
ncbi:hypothetical protein [Methylobacterium indicum]|uniref:Heme exporter protein D n=1 Tax=Methylobacterium indicum TaxID=1775910 RepID=A0A8H8WZN1_9HYPH|nr:hypothetical protein [Methylobacterium indicum]BCM87054.1 hypothetical protein mvi_55150 [Methylobacterium indicum]